MLVLCCDCIVIVSHSYYFYNLSTYATIVSTKGYIVLSPSYDYETNFNQHQCVTSTVTSKLNRRWNCKRKLTKGDTNSKLS